MLPVAYCLLRHWGVYIPLEAADSDDKLRLIQTAQDIDINRIHCKRMGYPHIEFVNSTDPTQVLRDPQDRADTLAKQRLTDEIHKTSEQAKNQSQDYGVTIRKNNILTHLKKLTRVTRALSEPWTWLTGDSPRIQTKWHTAWLPIGPKP